MSFVHSASGRNSSSQTASMFTIKQNLENFKIVIFHCWSVERLTETMFALYIQAKNKHTHFLKYITYMHLLH